MSHLRWVYRNDGDLIIKGVMRRFRWNNPLKRKMAALSAIVEAIQYPFLGKSA